MTRHAVRLSVAMAPAFSYSGLAAVSLVVALTRKYSAPASMGTPAMITSESSQEK